MIISKAQAAGVYDKIEVLLRDMSVAADAGRKH